MQPHVPQQTTMSDPKSILDAFYQGDEPLPWDNPVPPPELVALVESGDLAPCNALDVGCGLGYYSIYLAQQGFTVTGIDISPTAVLQAQVNATVAGVSATFQALDVRQIATLNDRYGFVFEWGMLHFLMPEFREQYVGDLAKLVIPGGKYMVLTFNEASPEWGGGKYRIGRTGAKVYYSSMDELIDLYAPCFRVIESRIRPTYFTNTGITHLENYLLLERR